MNSLILLIQERHFEESKSMLKFVKYLQASEIYVAS